MKRLFSILFAALLLCACTASPSASTSPSQPTAAPTQPVCLSIPDVDWYAGFSDALAAKLAALGSGDVTVRFSLEWSE